MANLSAPRADTIGFGTAHDASHLAVRSWRTGEAKTKAEMEDNANKTQRRVDIVGMIARTRVEQIVFEGGGQLNAIVTDWLSTTFIHHSKRCMRLHSIYAVHRVGDQYGCKTPANFMKLEP